MTHSFNVNKKSIILFVSHKGSKWRTATGITTNIWNSKAKSLPAKCQDAHAWEKLRPIHLRLLDREGEAVTAADVEAIIHYGITGEEKKAGGAYVPTFWEYFVEWADRDSPAIRQRRNTRDLIRRLMGDKDDWDDIDSAYYFRLVSKLKAEKYSINYIGSVVAKLKTVMAEGEKMKYHSNGEYHKFKRTMEQPDTIYLTQAELDALWAIPLRGARAKARDLFLLGCYTAMRYSDYSRLSLDNIRDGKIYLTQRKTAGSVVVPASPKVVAILERNGGKAPAICQEVLNREIKEVCREAGIDTPVEVTKSKGAAHVTQMLPKYTQVCSHTARRTAATLLFQTGVSLQSLMLITGHKTLSALTHYLRLGKEENAEALKDNAFFK